MPKAVKSVVHSELAVKSGFAVVVFTFLFKWREGLEMGCLLPQQPLQFSNLLNPMFEISDLIVLIRSNGILI